MGKEGCYFIVQMIEWHCKKRSEGTEKVNNANIQGKGTQGRERAKANVEELPEVEGCLVCSGSRMKARTHSL